MQTSPLLTTLLEKPRIGLMTDMDGTISPIVEHPEAAQVTPHSRELLEALHAHLALVAVVSGRGASDLRTRVGLADLVYVGNHGLETWQDGQVVPVPETATFRPGLEKTLRALEPHLVPGIFIEDKGATVSVHYRQTADPAEVAAMLEPILENLTAQHGLSLFQGRKVFELRPPVPINKGTAFHHLIIQHRLDGALYLGDDVTDADAMRVARQLRNDGTCHAVTIGVGAEDAPAVVRENADIMLGSVYDVESFLDWLLKAVSASAT